WTAPWARPARLRAEPSMPQARQPQGLRAAPTIRASTRSPRPWATRAAPPRPAGRSAAADRRLHRRNDQGSIGEHPHGKGRTWMGPALSICGQPVPMACVAFFSGGRNRMTSDADSAQGSKLQWWMLAGFAAGLTLGLLAYSVARDAAWIDWTTRN